MSMLLVPRRALTVGLALAFALALNSPDVALAKTRACSQKRPILAATPEAIVTVTRRLSARIYYGCAVRSGRTRRIGTFDGATGIGRVRLSGQMVGYEDAICGKDPNRCTGAVFVRDLQSNRVRRVAPIPEGSSQASDLEVFGDGAVAWIRSSGGTHQVVKADAAGVAVIGQSVSIVPTSLGASGSTLYWTDGTAAFRYDVRSSRSMPTD